MFPQSKMNGCPFCRSNKKPWTNHTAETCTFLTNAECRYCHEKGHTLKRCPTKQWEEECDTSQAVWEEQENIRKEEDDKKNTSWAAKANKVVSPETLAKMEEQDRKREEQRNANRVRKQNTGGDHWSRNMARIHGVKQGCKITRRSKLDEIYRKREEHEKQMCNQFQMGQISQREFNARENNRDAEDLDDAFDYGSDGIYLCGRRW